MIVLATPEATLAFGRALGEVLQTGDVVTLAGPLGAGKTLFAKGVLEGLGYAGDAPSPSFPIVIPYDLPAVRLPLAHADLYRIEDPSALDELGLDEALIDGALVVEWPERAPGLWPEALALTLSVDPDGARGLTAQVPPAWEPRWPPR